MKNLLIVLMIISITSCASTIERKPLPPLEFEKTEPYEIDLSTIIKPDKPSPIFAYQDDDGNIERTDIDNANVVIFTKEEYKKIGQLVILTSTYKKLLKQQEVLINNRIEINNSLKEFVELERMKSQQYQDMWIDSENMYRYERQQHKQDNFFNKVIHLILTGAIIAIAI